MDEACCLRSRQSVGQRAEKKREGKRGVLETDKRIRTCVRLCEVSKCMRVSFDVKMFTNRASHELFPDKFDFK